jgi:serine-type D-Ala-D-Ala carboxypeptidase
MMPSLGFTLVVLIVALFALPAHAERYDFSAVDAIIEQAIADGRCPNAEIIVGRGDDILYTRVYGHRTVEPEMSPMTPGLVFDLASLTKPIATATSIMILHERGRLNVNDPVARHIPEFAAAGKESVTIAQCLTHTAGFIADNPMADYANGREHALAAIYAASLKHGPPGENFVYSDVGYIVLGEIVHRVAGRPLDQFFADEIARPLKMSRTQFRPDAAALADALVPTEKIAGQFRPGIVHDPRARTMGNVAGHAGLFGTAQDLSRFCRMLLNAGQLDDARILQPQTVAEMIKPRPGPGDTIRTFGFDVVSPYDSPRGQHFPKGHSFGHTGFTGTSLWIDPQSKVYIILLTSRLHPDGKGDVKKLRYDVGTKVGEIVGSGQ